MKIPAGIALAMACLLPTPTALAEAPRNATQTQPLMMGAADADDLLGKALYAVARAYDLKDNKEESHKALTKLLDEVPRHELAAEASYRVGKYLFVIGRYDAADRYLQQSLALLKPHELALRLAVSHDLAWTRFKQERVADALLEAKRFSAGVASEPLLNEPASRGTDLTVAIRSVAKLVAITEKCLHGRTLDSLRSDATFTKNFGALLPYLDEAYAAKTCAAPSLQK